MTRIEVIGPTSVERNDGKDPISSPRARTVLALLAVDPGQARTAEWLIEQLWAEPPPTSRKALQNTVVSLRRVMGAQAITFAAGSYRLCVEAVEIDRTRFLARADAAADAVLRGDYAAGVRHAEAALGEWRGQPYAGLEGCEPVESDRRMLTDRHVAVQIDLVECRLRSGLPLAAATVEQLVREQPWNERLWCLNAELLFREGRPADALDRLREGMTALAERGLDHGPAVGALEGQLLNGVLDLAPVGPPGSHAPGHDGATASPQDLGAESRFAPGTAVVLPSWDHHAIALADAGRDMVRGERPFSIITGPAGSGKTNLLQLAPSLMDPDASAQTVRCQVRAEGSLLRMLMGAFEAAGIPASGDGTGAGTTTSGAERLRESDYLGLLVRGVQEASLRQPVLVLVDDAHWAADAAATLGTLVQQCQGYRVGVVATARPGKEERSLRQLATTAQGRVLELLPLETDDVPVLLSAHNIVSRATDHPIASGQTPLFALLAASSAETAEPIREPDIITMLRGEVGRLGALARQAVQDVVLSIAPPSIEVLAAGSRATRPDMHDTVTELLDARLVVEVPGAVVVFAPAHDLVVEAVAGPMTATDRQAIHERVLRGLLAVDGVEADRPFQIAHHALGAAASGDPDLAATALQWAGRAAELAASAGAHREAAGWYRRTLELRHRTPDLVTPAHHGELLLGRAAHLFQCGSEGADEAFREVFDHADEQRNHELAARAALAWDRGMFSQVVSVKQDRIRALTQVLRTDVDGGRRARLQSALASELTWAPSGNRRFMLADEALELARSEGSVEDLAFVLGQRQLTIAAVDTTAMRREATEELLALSAHIDDPHLRFQAAFQRTAAAVMDGDCFLVDQLLDEAAGLAGRLSVAEYQWLVSFSRASLTLLEGDVELAEKQAHDALVIGGGIPRSSDPQVIFGGQLLEIRRLQGRLSELAPLLTDSGMGRGRDGLIQARYLAEAGLLDEAHDLVGTEALPDLGRRDPLQRMTIDNLARLAVLLDRPELARHCEGWLAGSEDFLLVGPVAGHCGHQTLGHLAQAQQDWERAAQHFKASHALHAGLGHPLLADAARAALDALPKAP